MKKKKMMVSDLSIMKGFEGYDETYSLPEFEAHLKVDLSSKECKEGWVFWRCEELIEEHELPAAADDDEELDNVTLSDLPFSGRENVDKVKCEMEKMTSSYTFETKYLVQFWAVEAEVVDHQQQHLYLTTSHQPFAVGYRLCKGLCSYRKRCMGHRYRVDEGADEGELGAVGRVYRNKYPESTPDLRLYSTNEFPLRDFAARCGGRAYFVLPIFDLLKQKCYGVIEVLCFESLPIYFATIRTLLRGLKASQLRTTHLKLDVRARGVDGEITKMLELANRVMPQLQMAQVWVPCGECSNTHNNLSCMERATSIVAENEEVDSWDEVDDDMFNYLEACRLHHLQIGNYTNMIAAVMLSNKKSCICRNICDFSVSENPLAHYAQKARLSFCFAICLQSLHNSREFYVVEFFLLFNSREDPFVVSFLSFLLRIMEMELKNFNFAYKGQHQEELVVEVLRGNMLRSAESCQSNALTYESFKYMHHDSEELSMLMVMEGCKVRYLLSDVTKYLQKSDLYYLQPSEECKNGWVFWSQPRQQLPENDVNSNSSLLPNRIQEKIKHLMHKITSEWYWNSYALAQFWAPKKDVDRCYLETSGQPFALGHLHKGLTFFRRQCMEHSYFVDEAAKEEELGPPGRVFLRGHPEITPDLRLYSPTEFPLRNHAAHCGLRNYLALPVFELNQHECVGVLEFVESRIYSPEVIGKALEAANLGSTHIKFEPSFQGSHLPGINAEPRELALTEIRDAYYLFAEIPQLYMVEVWVQDSKCPISINNTLSCMERAWATKSWWELDPPMCQIQRVEIRKGIAGMALASENKSCFCRNLSGFSIVDQPLAHHAQKCRLDVCFAICLQSRHTGGLLYVLEFYLNQDPGEYEYLRSFLYFLLQIMKENFKSFKVASGQKLGEKLVVEVIQFSEVNERPFSELDQPDEIPITFKFVKYGGRKHSKDIRVQFAPDNMESVRTVAQTEHCSTSAANLKKKDAAKRTTGGKMKADLNINLQDLEQYFGQKLKDVAEALGVSRSTIKRRLRDYGIQMWPWNEKQKKNRSLFMRGSANETAQDPQQNMRLFGFSNLPPLSDTPLHQNVPHTNPESSQGLIIPPKVDMVFIKAKHEYDTIKFELCHSAGMEKLVKEVATRLNLKMGSFKLKYLDEDNDEILLACETDLQLCLKSLAAGGKTFVQMIVQSI